LFISRDSAFGICEQDTAGIVVEFRTWARYCSLVPNV